MDEKMADLQIALATLVADWAVERVVHEKKLHHTLAENIRRS